MQSTDHSYVTGSNQPRRSLTPVSTYDLPCKSTILRQDRFGLIDSDDFEVSFWDLLTAVLAEDITSLSKLIETLETICILLHGKPRSDYGFLRHWMDRNASQDFFTRVWPFIKRLTLEMPKLFLSHSLPVLSPQTPALQLSRKQAACLVVQQFLGTVQVPAWQEGYQDFSVWYGSGPSHPNVVNAYLTALFKFFDSLADLDTGHTITYRLVSDAPGIGTDTPLSPVNVIRLDEASTAPEYLGLPDGAAVISANKLVGFGKSGTQEEAQVGASPEACPIVLVASPLEDGQVLVVTGAEAMVSIAGYGRGARLGEVLKHGACDWSQRTMLFVDALELDVVDTAEGELPDLQPGNIERELRKLQTGFGALKHSSSNDMPTISTGFWGCGAFGGNPEIKFCLQWCAASLAGCRLDFICSGEVQKAFADRLEVFLSSMYEKKCTTLGLQKGLMGLTQRDVQDTDSPWQAVIKLMSTE